jgi:hypothetical protein
MPKPQLKVTRFFGEFPGTGDADNVRSELCRAVYDQVRFQDFRLLFFRYFNSNRNDPI